MQPAVVTRCFVRPSILRRCAVFLFVAVILITCTSAVAQTGLTRIFGPEDQTVPVPAYVGTPGQKDAGALQELLDYLKAVNISAWQGMQASGTFTDSAGNTDQATLTTLGGDQLRLDVQTASGDRSMRISGSYGVTQEPNGKMLSMPPATARAGLLAFPQLLMASFPSSTTSFVDRGLVNIGGQSMHRITLQQPVFSDNTSTTAQGTVVTDLYFDPSTHLLLKSATAVQLDTADRELYLIVITYSDYQNVQGMLIPCMFSQSLNGQPQWTLRLNSPTLQPSVDSSYFSF